MSDRFNPSALSRRRPAKFALVLLTAFVVTTLVTFTSRARWSKPGSSTKQDTAATQKKPDPVRVETELITITQRGFEPAVITRPKGPVFLLVNNKTGLEEPALRLDRVTGGKLHEAKVHKKKRVWAELFDLNPGQYVLTEANNPAWICRITITAKEK